MVKVNQVDFDILPNVNSLDDYAQLFIRALPDGFLYNSSLVSFVRGFMSGYQDYYATLNKALDDIFNLDQSNFFLDEFLTMYGLPNVIFPNITNKDQAIYAIAMMRLTSQLISKEDFENFMLLLGFKVTLYSLNNALKDHLIFPYTPPAIPSISVLGKDLLTYLVYIEGNVGSEINLGVAPPVIPYDSGANITIAKNILEYLKPLYIIFQYISLETKEIFRL